MLSAFAEAHADDFRSFLKSNFKKNEDSYDEGASIICASVNKSLLKLFLTLYRNLMNIRLIENK